MSATNKSALDATAKAAAQTADELAGKIRDGGRSALRTAEDAGAALRQGMGEVTDAARDRIEDVKDAAGDALAEGRSRLGHMAQGARDRITSGAGATLATVRDAAVEKADEARETLSDVGQRLAATLKDASSGESGDAVKSRVLASVAEGLTQASDALRQRSVSELTADVRSLARRHPGAFIAVAAVAGFAVARFVRSSAERRFAQQGGTGIRS